MPSAYASLSTQMKSLNDPQDERALARSGKLEAETIADEIAIRYGFRPGDFTKSWDGGDFDAARSEHELVLTCKDGRRAAARIQDEALVHKDAWKYFRDVDRAFAQLRRRTATRGL